MNDKKKITENKETKKAGVENLTHEKASDFEFCFGTSRSKPILPSAPAVPTIPLLSKNVISPLLKSKQITEKKDFFLKKDVRIK